MLPYTEGTVFLVPITGGGYVRGVVARMNPEGAGVYGCFFGPRVAFPSDLEFDDLFPGNELLRSRFGDLGLINGEWPIVGIHPHWRRDDWRMPDFVRRDPLRRRKSTLVRYADDDPMRIEIEYPIDCDAGLTPDIASAYGAVEIKLGKLLQEKGGLL
jgi:hypothetical protein